MKIKRFIVLILITTIIICKNTPVYGKHIVGLDVDLPIICAAILQAEKETEGEERVVKNLKERFGYQTDENKVNKKVKFDTTVKILKPSIGRIVGNAARKLANKEMLYDIKIGKHDEDKKCGYLVVGEKDLKELYGCQNVNETEKPWNIVIIASVDHHNDTSNGAALSLIQYTFKINEIYNSYETNDYEEGKNVVIEEDNLNVGPTDQDILNGVSNAFNAAKKYSKFMEDFGVDQGSTIAEAICSFFTFWADVFQSLLDKLETLGDEIPGLDFSYTYTYNELKGKETTNTDDPKVSTQTDTQNNTGNTQIDTQNSTENTQTTDDENTTKKEIENKEEEKEKEEEEEGKKEEETDYSVLDKYTKVDKYDSEATSDDDKILINLNNNVDKFTMQTEIPVIPMDIYGIAYDKIDIYSVDFFNVKQKENNSEFWNWLRNVFSTIMHIVLYLSISLLLTLLIYHGINIIKSRNDNPANRATHMQGIYKFSKALLMLVSVVLIMTLCQTFTNQLVEIIGKNDTITDEQLPIRVNIKNLYSFSTNLTGYFRFMTQSTDVSRRCVFMIEYVVIVGMNILLFFLMMYRMLYMWFLGMMGMIKASMYVLGGEEQVKAKLNMQGWVKSYVLFAFIQVIIVTLYQIIEYSIIHEL